MAEAKKRDKEFDEEVEKAPAPAAPKPQNKKWKKFLLSVFLLIGIVTGMHMSGLIDVRPFVWGTVPKIPFVGETLKKYLDIPEVYTLTVEERRRLELEQWQARLDERERETRDKVSAVEAVSSDIAARTEQIKKQEEKQKNLDEYAKKPKEGASDEEKAIMDELIRTYQEISPRRAALIVARLRDELAVELLRKLPQDARASILSKLEPRKAATITEKMANPEN